MPTTALAPATLVPDPALRQRDYLLRVAQALGADLDLPAVLARVIRAAVSMTGGQAGAVALREADGEMRVVARFRLEERFEHDLDAWLAPGHGGAGRAATATSEPVVIDDAGDGDGRESEIAPELVVDAPAPAAAFAPEAAAPLSRSLRDVPPALEVYAATDDPHDTRQVLTLPLAIGEAPLGRIFVFRSEGAAAFTPLDGDLLQTFADQAAVAIQNAETHLRLQVRERRLAALVEHRPAGSLLLDARGAVVSANPAAESLLGTPEAALARRPIDAVVALEDDRGRAVALALPEAEATVTLLGYLRRADVPASPPAGLGAPDALRPMPYVQVALTPLPGPRGERAGFVVDVVDLTGYKEAEDAKRAFLAGLSHELKTPLALIRGFAETLRLPSARADGRLVDEALGVILDETDHLTRMVEQLLMAARLQAGALALERHVVDLASELRRVVDTFRQAHPDRAWALELAPDLPPISADPLRLREVLQNLLANAINYSDAGSPIRVDASAPPGASTVQISVHDTGIGIAREDQARVFDRFVRATDRGDGAGLGLYMSRAIAEAHGGRLDVASAPGEGSTFTLTLPCDAPPGRPEGGA